MVKEKGLFKNKFFWPIFLLILTSAAILLSALLLLGEEKTVMAQKFKLTEQNRDLERLDRILADLKNNKTNLEMVSQTIPSNYQEVAEAVSRFEKAASLNNQTLEIQIEPAAKPEPEGWQSLKITLKTAGAFSPFSKMMTTLADLPYHTQFDTLEINENKGNVSALVNTRLFIK